MQFLKWPGTYINPSDLSWSRGPTPSSETICSSCLLKKLMRPCFLSMRIVRLEISFSLLVMRSLTFFTSLSSSASIFWCMSSLQLVFVMSRVVWAMSPSILERCVTWISRRKQVWTFFPFLRGSTWAGWFHVFLGLGIHLEKQRRMLVFSPPYDLWKDFLVWTLMIPHKKRKLTLLSLIKQ